MHNQLHLSSSVQFGSIVQHVSYFVHRGVDGVFRTGVAELLPSHAEGGGREGKGAEEEGEIERRKTRGFVLGFLDSSSSARTSKGGVHESVTSMRKRRRRRRRRKGEEREREREKGITTWRGNQKGETASPPLFSVPFRGRVLQSRGRSCLAS